VQSDTQLPLEPGNFIGSWVLFALGAWEFFATFIWRYGSHHVIAANQIGFACLIAMFAFWTIATEEAWASWAIAGFGVWLVVSALIFERGVTAALVNDVVVGALVAVVAVFTARHSARRWERGFQLIERGEGHLTG
jgi:hypothetical protein